MAKRDFGNIRRRASGRYQARYTGPDGRTYSAPGTFDTPGYARRYLERVSADIQRGVWEPPSTESEKTLADRPELFGTYAASWLKDRDLAERTRGDYARILGKHISPTFEMFPVGNISPAMVREWHAALKDSTGPTMRAHSYALLRTILNTAVTDDVIVTNPCRIRGAGYSKRARKIRPATLPELETIAGSTPPRYRLMVLLAAWCALRFGELAELRRSDIDVKNGVVRVRRGVVRPGKDIVVKDPKSEAGRRDVAIPPHLMPMVKAHLSEHVAVAPTSLVFPAASGGHMAPSALFKVYKPAREKAARPDLRFHDLRHTGAVLAAATGATLAELMARLGHSTVSAAMRYQHAAADRDKVIAEALSKMAEGTVTPISSAKGKRKRA